MSGLHDLNGPRKAATGPAREAEYLCLRCPWPVWRQGGVSSLGRHQAAHGGREVFPHYQLIDAAGAVVDFEGHPVKVDRQPVPASRDVTGWVRSRAVIVVPLVKDREGSR